jgi:drug/metabolite transporter (DMT)-like permease
MKRLALMALAAIALLWGYNWVVMKEVLVYVGPFDFSALRTVFGAVSLLLAVMVTRRRMRIVALPRVIVLGILQTGVFSILVQTALINGAAGKTSILAYTMPFWVIPMAWLAFGERVRGLQWMALALAGVGLVLIFEPWAVNANLQSSLLAVAAGLCWAFATIIAKSIRRDFAIDALSLTIWQMLFGALALCIAAWLVPERPISPTPYFYMALIYNSIIATGLAWFLWLFALQHLSAGVTGMSSLGVPVVGVLAGWLQLGERPSATELVGMAMIAAALAVISMRGMRR